MSKYCENVWWITWNNCSNLSFHGILWRAYERPEIWHADASWPFSVLIRFWPLPFDFSNITMIWTLWHGSNLGVPGILWCNTEMNKHGFPSLCTELTLCKYKTVISSVYKHPKVSKDFCHWFSLITHEDLAFVGDMNCCPSKSDQIKTFCDLYDLSNLINYPTGFKGSTPTILNVL